MEPADCTYQLNITMNPQNWRLISSCPNIFQSDLGHCSVSVAHAISALCHTTKKEICRL